MADAYFLCWFEALFYLGMAVYILWLGQIVLWRRDSRRQYLNPYLLGPWAPAYHVHALLGLGGEFRCAILLLVLSMHSWAEAFCEFCIGGVYPVVVVFFGYTL